MVRINFLGPANCTLIQLHLSPSIRKHQALAISYVRTVATVCEFVTNVVMNHDPACTFATKAIAFALLQVHDFKLTCDALRVNLCPRCMSVRSTLFCGGNKNKKWEFNVISEVGVWVGGWVGGWVWVCVCVGGYVCVYVCVCV